jgi:hypothetical protein
MSLLPSRSLALQDEFIHGPDSSMCCYKLQKYPPFLLPPFYVYGPMIYISSLYEKSLTCDLTTTAIISVKERSEVLNTCQKYILVTWPWGNC